ncbi:putative family 3 extracellular solute-binding protein [Magnetofaba australis IT-1]|uniref:Putative family 3 extracellular solute-binding protein n=1 Tax=Magnetofaba australis IT-1 TaxID=1434232 RepID=A0A1Y2K7Y3_9PROT|nr:putative family 3 extracellular solute-binding protein [Magnetofaba australis IT-1]
MALFAVLALGLLLGAPCAQAEGAPGKTLKIAIKESPPFVMRDPQSGEWEGLTIRLWREIAEKLDLTYEYVPLDLSDMLKAVESGQADVGAAALTVTAERETAMDFSHPYFTSGLGIAIPSRAETSLLGSLMESLFSWPFLKAMAALGALLLVTGVLVWIFERKQNAEQFGGSALKGIGVGFWWSAVTMTTVGYGDKAPRTLGGRIIALVWMFAGIITISSFTAMITSALTISSVQDAKVKGPADLLTARVGAISATTSERHLNRQGVRAVIFPEPDEALQALADGKLDAVVYDAPILRYLINEKYAGVAEVLPGRIKREEYALAYPQGSALREPVNRILLEYRNSQTWRDAVMDKLGAQDGGWAF